MEKLMLAMFRVLVCINFCFENYIKTYNKQYFEEKTIYSFVVHIQKQIGHSLSKRWFAKKKMLRTINK